MKDNLLTRDLYLSAFLSLIGFSPSFSYAEGTVFFVFNREDAIYRAMADFNSGAQVDVAQYAQAIKRLRAEMLMRKTDVHTG